MPTLVKSTGVSGAFKIGLLSAIPFLCAIVVMNLLGHSADRRRERRWHLIVPAWRVPSVSPPRPRSPTTPRCRCCSCRWPRLAC